MGIPPGYIVSMGSTESAFRETPNAQPGSVESSDIFNSLTRLRLPEMGERGFQCPSDHTGKRGARMNRLFRVGLLLALGAARLLAQSHRRRIHSPRTFDATTTACATTSFAQPTRCRKTNTDFGRRRTYEHSRSRSRTSPTTSTTSAPPPGSRRNAPYTDIEGRLSKKADLVLALKDAFAYCDTAYDAMTDATSLEPSSGIERAVQVLVLAIGTSGIRGNITATSSCTCA